MAKVNIYSPTYWRFEKTKIAVTSIIESFKNSKHDIHYYIIDNNSPQEMKDWLSSLECGNVTIVLNNKNLGKAKGVNFVHEHARKSDFVISIDSDMKNTHDEYCWVDEMINILDRVPNIGVLSSFQEVANCHHYQALGETLVVDSDGTKHVVRYGHFGGVAGGCIAMRTGEFDHMDGYTVYDVYNGDDAKVMRKCHEVLRKVAAVATTVGLEHMQNYEDEKDYQQWKFDKCQGRIPSDGNAKGFFDK